MQQHSPSQMIEAQVCRESRVRIVSSRVQYKLGGRRISKFPGRTDEQGQGQLPMRKSIDLRDKAVSRAPQHSICNG